MTDKPVLLQQILEQLTRLLQQAREAAMLAHQSATDKENVAENKYDTLGLEASYLAQGQAQRVAEIELDIEAFSEPSLQTLAKQTFSNDMEITMGALVGLIDENQHEQNIFLGPSAGGLKLRHHHKDIMVITVSAPLGQALLGCLQGDEFDLKVADQQKSYEIISVE